MLNKRQAGAAIEGALRQRQVELDRVAVDTHGFTYPAMTFAKLALFDLCPRLAHLSDRKLFVPNDMHLPSGLAPVTERGVYWRRITKEWDALTRIAASISTGWCPATLALERFGSAAQGNPTYEAAVALGKLLRTVYLCDFFGNPSFRRDIEALLSQGEFIHTLQRAIYNGPVGIRRKRSQDELAGASHSLALLTNIVMAYNTRAIQRAMAAEPDFDRAEMVRHVAPTGFEHINLRGVFTFGLDRYRHSLLDQAA